MKNKINNLLLAEGFRHFSEMSYEAYLPYQERIECSDLTYVMLYAYDEEYPYLVKKVRNGLVITGVDTKFEAFCVIIPLEQEELPFIYEEMAALFQRLGISMRLGTMSERYMRLLEHHPLTEKISFQEERSDYVYDIGEYLDLEGGKNARKRRDLNKIKSEYDDICVKTIQDFQAEKGTILSVMDKWCEGYDCDLCQYGCERKIIEKILNSDLINKLYGAVLYIENRPEMFAIAQIINDTCYLYFKKSVGRIQGLFYYFEYEFLLPLKDLRYVNFEEDMGLPGLREYKRRRHPVKMIDKYDIQIRGMREIRNRKEGRCPEDEKAGCLERATGEDETFIIKLWQEAFHDSETYIRKFLDAHRNTETDGNRAFLWKENGLCRAMLFAIPAKIKEMGKLKNARYLYAIATEKEYRGNKYLRQMLPELKKIFGEECILFLVPEPGVIPYYESLGFIGQRALPGFLLRREMRDKAEVMAASEGLILKKITDVFEYCSLRNANLADRDYVIWDEHEISWALYDISMAQGAAYVVECDYGKYLLAGIRRENGKESSFQVIETTLPGQLLEELKMELMDRLGCTELMQQELFYMVEQGKTRRELYLSLALNG